MANLNQSQCNIIINKEKDSIIGEIHIDPCVDDSNLCYAFYLYCFNARVSVIFYQNKKECVFNIKDNGKYHVIAFIKQKNEDFKKAILIRSNDINIGFYSLSRFNIIEKNFSDDLHYDDLKHQLIHFKGEDSYQHVDVFFNNIDNINKFKYMLVCFSGAVVNRKDHIGPFFSGKRLSDELNIPLISISDPSVDCYENLNLGWYLGNEMFSKCQNIICDIINKIVDKINKELIFIGGSGGGFASLNYLTKINDYKAKAFIWNP